MTASVYVTGKTAVPRHSQAVTGTGYRYRNMLCNHSRALVCMDIGSFTGFIGCFTGFVGSFNGFTGSFTGFTGFIGLFIGFTGSCGSPPLANRFPF